MNEGNNRPPPIQGHLRSVSNSLTPSLHNEQALNPCSMMFLSHGPSSRFTGSPQSDMDAPDFWKASWSPAASLLILLAPCKASRPIDTSAAETAVVVPPFKLPHAPGIAGDDCLSSLTPGVPQAGQPGRIRRRPGRAGQGRTGQGSAWNGTERDQERQRGQEHEQGEVEADNLPMLTTVVFLST